MGMGMGLGMDGNSNENVNSNGRNMPSNKKSTRSFFMLNNHGLNKSRNFVYL